MDRAAIGIGAAAGLAAGMLLASAWAKRRLAELQRRSSELDAELNALKTRPEKQEYRLERFELLWYPTVSSSPQDKTIVGVAPGLPHCRACVLPLSLEGQAWRCRQCGSQHPESLADVTVMDAITQQALKHFHERHPGYRVK